MADSLTIPSGTKLQLAFDVPIGKQPDFNMICTFGKALDASAFLISIPMLAGKALVLDENQKFLFHFAIGNENQVMAAYPDAIVKEGIRRYWKMRRVTEMRQFFKRKDERYKIALRIEYSQPTWRVSADGTIHPEEAMTLDISAGGLAAFINGRYEVGEVLEIKLPRIGTDPAGAAVSGIIGAVCWMREAPKGSIYRNIIGLQFRVDSQRELIANYIDYAREKFKL